MAIVVKNPIGRTGNVPCWVLLCKSSILDTDYDATSLFDFPSFFYLSKGQEREAYQYNKLHIDRGKYQEEHIGAQTGEWICWKITEGKMHQRQNGRWRDSRKVYIIHNSNPSP